jgi:hypothetical protein
MLPLAVIDEEGNDDESATIVYTRTDGSAIGDLYAAASGGSPATTHLTDSLGEIVRYRESPIRARYTVNGGTAKTAEFSPDPETVFLDGDTVARALDGYSGTDWALTVRSLNALSKSLRVANVNDDSVFTVQRAASGNDVVSINLLSSTVPTLNLLEVRRASGTTGYVLSDFELQTTAPSVVHTTLSATGKQTVAGSSNVVGVRGIVERSGAASGTAGARALEGRIKLTTGGTGSAAGGFQVAVAAVSDTITSGVVADAGFYAGGPGAGFSYGFYYETAAAAQIASISSTGVVLAGNGTAALPAYSFVSGPNMGLSRAGVNALGVSTSGVLQYMVTPVGLLDFRNVAAQFAANGGGAIPILGTIGGTGPTLPNQAGWLKIALAGAGSYLPLWQ